LDIEDSQGVPAAGAIQAGPRSIPALLLGPGGAEEIQNRRSQTQKNGLIFYPLTPVLHQCKFMDGSKIAKLVGGEKKAQKRLNDLNSVHCHVLGWL